MTTPPGLPDLRSLFPWDGPPQVPPLPYRSTPAQQEAHKAQQRVRRDFVAASARRPLPPYVWVLATYGPPVLMRVLAPATVEIWPGPDKPVALVRVTGVVRPWVRGSHLTLVDDTGTKHRMSVRDPGAIGPAEVGASPVKELNDEPLLVDTWHELRDFVIGVVVIPYLIVRALVCSPASYARARRRRAERNRIAGLIQP